MAEVWLEKSLALGREAENKSIQRDMGHAMLSKVEDGHGFHGQPRTERKWKTGKQKLKEKKAITHIRRQYGFKKLTLKQDLQEPRGLPWGLRGKEPTFQCRKHGFDPWVGQIPWRRKWHPTPVFLPGEFHGQRILVGYSPWGCRVSHN